MEAEALMQIPFRMSRHVPTLKLAHLHTDSICFCLSPRPTQAAYADAVAAYRALLAGEGSI